VRACIDKAGKPRVIVVSHLAELRKERSELKDPLGLVPTMGFLHAGHLSLVQRAREQCGSVAVSIFVNPPQFDQSEDLKSYPKDLKRDLGLLKKEGVDLVWTPTVSDMYPSDFQTWVEVQKLTEPLEGAHRPDHFKGVTTVVAKLFNAVQPQRAYFGQKDAQQALVVRRMVRDLDFPTEIVVCPTIREKDGLAMSSRNSNLDEDERAAATVLYQALSAAQNSFESGVSKGQSLKRIVLEILESEPLANVEYVSVANPETLEEITGSLDHGLVSMAVKIGKTRLIDNLVLGN
jgi:pantoate--beta-alanine ligase